MISPKSTKMGKDLAERAQSNEIEAEKMVNRRQSPLVQIGNQTLGGNSPVLVQSMTNTPTEDPTATANQIRDLYLAGSEIVRVTVNTKEAAQAIPKIVSLLEKMDLEVPIVGDFHYNGHLLLKEYPDCARLLAKYRINPGNVGRGDRHDNNFKDMIEAALKFDKPVRIGVNWGSLDQDLLASMMDENSHLPQPLEAHAVLIEAIVESAIQSARLAQKYGMAENKLVLSAKVSEVPDLIKVYEELANRCHYALHLGLTEAGMGNKGVVSTTAALSVLLMKGIGDTIRCSLTPRPGASRTEEVEVCQQILQSIGIRSFMPKVTACPGCGRTTSTVFQELAQEIEQHLAENKRVWQEKYEGVENLNVAVMGCIVNGPGESKHANIGISLPGTGEEPRAPIYIDGEYVTTLFGPTLTTDFIRMVNDYVENRYARILVN